MGGGGAGSPASTKKKALRATSSDGDGDGASVPPVEQQKPAPLPAAGVVAGNAADGSAVTVHQSCGGEEEQDDEQVERFYALLANIRALRGLYSAGTGPASPGRSSRKRAREAEPPWTPAFRLEDFEVEEDVNQGASGGVARRPAAATRARTAAAAAADDVQEEVGVAEVARGGNKLGRRRVAARG